MTTFNVDQLVGRRISSERGEKIGRVQAIEAEQVGDDWVITELRVGGQAALERFSAWMLHALLPHRWRPKPASLYRIPWDKIDLSDPKHLRMRGSDKHHVENPVPPS
jgi:sporulation protein YlmC with PRC-barrel domain